jgi:hypothetical protein
LSGTVRTGAETTTSMKKRKKEKGGWTSKKEKNDEIKFLKNGKKVNTVK